MRSRYSAYVLNDLAYIRATWWPGCAPAELAPDVHTRWLGLEVKRHGSLAALPLQALPGEAAPGLAAPVPVPMASVTFVARYRIGGGSAVRLQETSRFALVAERWWYVDGIVKN
jgi:SEC-C motif-containing protein